MNLCYDAPVAASVSNGTTKNSETFFFCMLKLSMMTPMKRLSVKNEPKTMKKTKYKYM